MNDKNIDSQNPLDFKELEHLKFADITAKRIYNKLNIIVLGVNRTFRGFLSFATFHKC